MPKKICTECQPVKDSDIGIIRKNVFPPTTYLPDPEDIVELNIDMGPHKFANKHFFYYASESNKMLLKDGKNIKKMSELEAYDDFENSGLAVFDNSGKAKIVLVQPSEYMGNKKKKYPPHVHFRVSFDGKTWSKTEYTVAL